MKLAAFRRQISRGLLITTVQLTVKKGKQTSSDSVTITVLDEWDRLHVPSSPRGGS